VSDREPLGAREAAGRRLRVVADVSRLPTVVFGNRAVEWWGTLGFVVIEGFTLAIVAAAYLYLRKNFIAWPPYGAMLPDLLIPTLQVLAMAASIPAMVWLQRAAKRLDAGAVTIGLALGTAFVLLFCWLRWYEFRALNVRWDTDAYGSAAWAILAFHATLLVLQAYEVGGMLLIFLTGRVEPKHFSDVNDVAYYWHFMVGFWFVLYLLVFWSPRVL
jgi:heme/copper-type cytochrome/quinol oxidase subunit 3